MMEMTGYSHPIYALSLAEFGTPHALTQSGGWILERPIPKSSYRDGMGCYPIFVCTDWSRLENDFRELEGKFVSLALVSDPFGDYSIDVLKSQFDICFLFKEHYVTDLSQPVEMSVRKRYQKYARSALKNLTIEYSNKPTQYLSEWTRLYKYLIDRHSINGIRAFSEKSFKMLFSIPGVEMFIAKQDQEIIGADIWVIDGEVGYAHLSAISPLGYELRAPYALYWTAMQSYSRSLRWLSHGASAGLSQERDGLAIFKKGWATGTRPVYFCGKVLDESKYKELTRTIDLRKVNYFPAYRNGEFY
jgi:hypothetical protein